MKGNGSARPAPATVDIAVSHPRDGRMWLTSRYFFADPGADVCRQLIERLFELDEVRAVEVRTARALAQVEYTNGVVPSRQVIEKISRHLRRRNGRGKPPIGTLRALPVALTGAAGEWRIERHGRRLSTWRIVREWPGYLRARNPLVRRNASLCRAIERALGRLPGVETAKTSPSTGSALIVYDPRRVKADRLIEWLDQALIEDLDVPAIAPVELRPGEIPAPLTRDSSADRSFTGQEHPWSRGVSVTFALSLGIAGVAALVYPPLGWLSVPGTVYVTRGLYASGFRALVHERRIAVDTMTACIHLASIATGHFFIFVLNSAVFQWARNLLDKVKQDSRANYTDLFRHEARTVWIRVDGADVEVPLEQVKAGDLVSLTAGQTIPVDGRVVEGTATVDQHLLTGEAAPVDRGVGDEVFALTVVLSGRIGVRVERTGAATAAAHIARVLDNTVDFKTGRQLQAERLSDRLVAPALVGGLLTWPFLGPSAAGAFVDSHPKYKTTLSTSVGLLNYFKLAAREGLLIKDGRTLELLTRVDTVVFDKTGTLTLAQPRAARVYARAPHAAADVLRLAAAAEQHQSHPLARAILHAAGVQNLSVPAIDETEYRPGYGLTTRVEGHRVRVGSLRFLENEALPIPPSMADVERRCHAEGQSLVLVAVDGEVAGAIELHPAIRPEAARIIAGLRERGVTATYLISGDHQTPTRSLAATLGIDHCFAETLPERKAALVAELRDAGRVICYVGDGINDSIAMKTAHVSVSLRGAATLATDTAEVVLLDESLTQLCRLFDVARECQRSTKVTMAAVFVPSLVCAAGVVLLNFNFTAARLINVTGLAMGLGAGMLPLLTHSKPPAVVAPDTAPAGDDVPLEEVAIP